MARTRRSNLPVEGSWRMVEEGENDSFDTTIIQDAFEDDFIISSGQSQLTSSSQDLASQDSIHDFADRADEDQVILRAPFQPSLISTRHASVDKERTPVPEFFMPTVAVSSPRRSSARSSRTIRPVANDSAQTRRRVLRRESTDESHYNYSTQAYTPNPPRQTRALNNAARKPSVSERFTSSAPGFIFDCLAWVLSVVGMAFRFVKWPVAFLLAVYIAVGISVISRKAVTQSVSASLQPICHLPVVSLFSLPFCPDDPIIPVSKGGAQPLEFDELMNVQSQFEKVMEDSARGVSLPMEMRMAEASVRDLRTVVKYSDLPAREELVFEFNGYIESVNRIINDLQSFNTHVGGAVDSVISVNRWTLRYIDSITVNREAHGGLISPIMRWIFSPFQLALDERMILDKYIEHAAFVSDKIQKLILEAQAILRLLSRTDDHLERIHEFVVRQGGYVKEKRREVLWDLWTLLGANNNRLYKLSAQLVLLREVEAQRASAVTQLLGLIHDLGDIQTKLNDLRNRVAETELLADTTSIPLSVHIETINAGIERLDTARIRIRAEEEERLQEVFARAKRGTPRIDP
ncbi:hypothetical protein EKO27_g1975 [Xylaria grammica]|uniref:Uncharacterized protein n=1 Tax=Xylaria grammica TaxID=363999 RepID=A0A439DFG6_9PEZI|nr:hypothetical protein EKO27_g1975 [Xylaria grammica]